MTRTASRDDVEAVQRSDLDGVEAHRGTSAPDENADLLAFLSVDGQTLLREQRQP